MSHANVLKDDGARRDAISLHDQSILVEAGAGSGKTAACFPKIPMVYVLWDLGMSGFGNWNQVSYRRIKEKPHLFFL